MARRKLVFPGSEPRNPYQGCNKPWSWRPGPEDPEYYDAGWRAVRFIETYCRHTKGQWKGRRFILLPFQLLTILYVFGTVDHEGARIIRTALLEWARKNGKSELAAAIVCKLLYADGEEGAEIYGAAYDRDQASVVYEVVADMVELSPRLRSRSRVIRSRKRIVVPKTGSFYVAIPADAAGAQGFNAHGIIFDEVHTQRNRDLWDALNDSVSTRQQPLTIAITTAGDNHSTLARDLHDRAERIRKGLEEDPSWYADVRNTPKKADWTDERTWYTANPGLGTAEDIAAGRAFKKIEALRQKAIEAQQMPAYQNNFRRFHLNQWVSQATRWLDLERWDASAGMVDEEKLRGRRCWSGLDLASTTDIAALVHVFPDPDDPEAADVVARFWIPEENLLDRERRDQGAEYSQWVREGWLRTTPGNVIDYAAIRATFDADATKFEIAEVNYDPWGATQLVQELEAAELPVNPLRQTVTVLSPATKELNRRILQKKLRHGGNPVLRWMADNVVVVSDHNENIKPDRKKSAGRIDGIVGLVMAIDGVMNGGEAQPGEFVTM